MTWLKLLAWYYRRARRFGLDRWTAARLAVVRVRDTWREMG